MKTDQREQNEAWEQYREMDHRDVDNMHVQHEHQAFNAGFSARSAQQSEEVRQQAKKYSKRENELTHQLSRQAFEDRALGRSRYHDRLFAENRPRPTNEEFDEGFAFGLASAKRQQADELAAGQHRVLVLASYCTANSDCSERRPCHDCLLMCNVAAAVLDPSKIYDGLEYSAGLELDS